MQFLFAFKVLPESTQSGHLSVGRSNEYLQKLGRSKQAHREMH